MKVLHVLPENVIGGAEKQTAYLLENFKQTNIKFKVLFAFNKNTRKFELFDQDMCFSLFREKRNRFISYIFTPYRILKKRKFFNQFDVIHCHLTWGAWFGIIIRVLQKFSIINRKTNLIITFHFSYGTTTRTNYLMHHLAAHLFDKIILVSIDKSYFRNCRAIETKSIQINNGVTFPSEYFCKYNNNEAYYKIGILSRLAKDRHLEIAFDHLKSLEEMIPSKNFLIIIAGDGSDRQSIEEYVDKIKFKNKAIFLGFVKDLENFFSDLTLLVTLVENSYPGVSGLESISYSTPVLGYTLGENSTNSEPIITFPNNQTDKHSDITSVFLNHDFYSEYMRRLFLYCKNNYSIEQTAKRHIELYNKLKV